MKRWAGAMLRPFSPAREKPPLRVRHFQSFTLAFGVHLSILFQEWSETPMRRRSHLNPRQTAPAAAPQRPGKPWWRPLTNRWGIFGVIIFVGLVMALIERASEWVTRGGL